MAEIQPDLVFQNVVPGDAVTFCGWLEDGGGGSYQLWTTPALDERLEFTAEQILYRIPGAQRPDGSSVVWVKRDAIIAKCKVGRAEDFARPDPSDPPIEPVRVPKY